MHPTRAAEGDPDPAGDIAAVAVSAPSISEDAMLDGRVILRQPRIGYRAGLDAALLAAAVEVAKGERALEAGCGAGAALFQCAVRQPHGEFVGVERDPSTLALARDNVILNGLQQRVRVLGADVQRGFARLELAAFDSVFANPPFFDDPATLRAPHPARRNAYFADGGLEAWAGFMLGAARDGGRIILIHRAERLADLFRLLVPRAGSFSIRPVQTFSDQPAKRILIRAVKTGKAPLRLLPALVLHDRSGSRHTPAADAILRGEAGLGWD